MIAPVERVGYSLDLLPSRVQIAYAGAALGGSAAGLSRLEEHSIAEYVSSP